MDQSLESSGTSDDEALETKLARLQHNFAETLEAARKAQDDSSSSSDKPVESEKPTPRPLNLRFPPRTRDTLVGFDDERFSEDAQYSFGMDSEDDDTHAVSERRKMLLEDACSHLLASTQPQRLLFSPQTLDTLKSCLEQLKPGDEADITLGRSIFVLRLQDPDEIAQEYVDILEATETLEEVAQVQEQPEEPLLAAEAPETDEAWQAKVEEYQSAWDLLLEQRRNLEIRESHLIESEDALRSQYVALEKARLDLEAAQMTQEKASLKWNDDLIQMKKVVEGLLHKLSKESILARESLEDPVQKQRRTQLEKDLTDLKAQALALPPDPDLSTHLDLTEEALIEAVRSGKTAKFKIRLSGLKTKIASLKTAAEIAKHNSKAAGINNALEVIANESIYTRSKSNVQNKLREKFGVEGYQSVSPRTASPQLLLSPTQSVLSQGLSVNSDEWPIRCTSVLPGRLSTLSSMDFSNPLSPRRSPVPSCSPTNADLRLRSVSIQNQQAVTVYKQMLTTSEARAEKWRTLACDLQAQVNAFNVRESQIMQEEAKCRAWEKRLISLEKDLRSREDAVRKRETAVSLSEDNLLLRAGKFLSETEAQDIVDSSFTRLHVMSCDLEAEKAELVAAKTALSADQVTLQERSRLIEQQWREVRAVQTRLAKGATVVDSIQQSVGEFLSVLRLSL